MNPTGPSSSPTTGQVALGDSHIRISRHAINRYSERVDCTADRSVAFQAIAAALAAGTVRTTPRWWTTCRLAPGTRLVYSAVSPDLCLIIKNGTVVTLVTRELCARARALPRPSRDGIRLERYSRSDRVFEDDGADIYEPLPEDLTWVV
jgi:hypothetical protein